MNQSSMALRPREKLARQSVASLSLHELLQALIGKGVVGYPIRRVARLLLKDIHRFGRMPSYDRLLLLPGIGEATAARITASYELSRRLQKEASSIIEPMTPRMIHYWLYGATDDVVAQGRLNAHRDAWKRLARTVVRAGVARDATYIELEVHDYRNQHRPDTEDRELAAYIAACCDTIGLGVRRYDFYGNEQKVSLR